MMILVGFALAILFICALILVFIVYFAYKRNKNVLECVGDFITIVRVERAMPADYVRTFENNASGQKVLEQLITVFATDTYVRGGADAERESCYKQGQKSVIDHINYAIARAKTNTEEKLDE